MDRRGRQRLRPLRQRVRDAHPELETEAAIGGGRVVVDGRTVTNPASLVRSDATITISSPGGEPLRGEAKLAAALDAFAVDVRGRVALDLGAAAGGFTRVLLRAGAARVYAVDTGFGQLLGSLRVDPAVVCLERTNLADLGPALVPEPVDVVTADLSYVALARAIPQLDGRVALAPAAQLVALVKPQFELGLAAPPVDPAALEEAVRRAVRGVEEAGWRPCGAIPSPVAGARGAVEFLLHARRGPVNPRAAAARGRRSAPTPRAAPPRPPP
jgi:23S rRNA (cytidine1920-2'-O)/16S rRNA (cytidine1409-2'-O)-methyltransferase